MASRSLTTQGQCKVDENYKKQWESRHRSSWLLTWTLEYCVPSSLYRNRSNRLPQYTPWHSGREPSRRAFLAIDSDCLMFDSRFLTRKTCKCIAKRIWKTKTWLVGQNLSSFCWVCMRFGFHYLKCRLLILLSHDRNSWERPYPPLLCYQTKCGFVRCF